MIKYLLQQEKIKKLFSIYSKNLNNHTKKSEKIKICILEKTGIKTEFCAALTRPHAPLDVPSRALTR